jgi:oligopeptide transport system substrate-binding protein
MRKRTRIPALAGMLVLLAATLLAIGCDRGSKSESSKRDRAAGQTGELRIPGSDPLTLDPAIVSDFDSALYIVEIFGGLVTLDRNLKIVPDIAREWTVSDDGKTYTFKLRDDVVFQGSGRTVTASDFKYSIERAADPATNSPVAETYLGDIVGVEDMLTGKAKDVSGVKVVDDTTLQIAIAEPLPYFLAKLTYPTAFVVDKEQIAKDPKNWSRKPNGTGPFILQEWKVGERIVLVPNDRYYGEPKPKLSKVTYTISGGSILTQYENGEIDIAGVGVNDIERIRDKSDKLNKEFAEKPDLSTSYIAFNTTQVPFDDPKVRQAFALALDKDRIAKVIAKDLLIPATTVLPPGMPGYSKDQKGLGFDPQRAKQLLAESKYGMRLPRVVLTQIGTGSSLGPFTEALLEMWKQNLGIEVEVEQVETATFVQDVSQHRYQMWEFGWSADYPDPQNFIEIHFYSKSRQNDTLYNNPQVDRLLLRARTEKDNETRFKTYREAEALILQDAPWIPLFHSTSAVLVKPYVKGWQPTPMVIETLKYVSVEK